MAWNFRQVTDGSAEVFADPNSASENTFVRVIFETDVDVEIGRGSTDTDVTYFTLRDADGAKWYAHTTDGSALSLTSTRP